MQNLDKLTEDEMILAFLREDTQSDTWRYAYEKAPHWHRRTALLEHPDLNNTEDNLARRQMLGARGYGQNEYLFGGFPQSVEWRRHQASIDELGSTKYILQEKWDKLSGKTRYVRDGARYVGQHIDAGDEHVAEIIQKVQAICDRLRRGDRFGPVIAVRGGPGSELVLLDGHHRATAMVCTGIPAAVEMIIGISTDMYSWPFYGCSRPSPPPPPIKTPAS
jgi:hypothetical protein